jgi:micrococcal nuclease
MKGADMKSLRNVPFIVAAIGSIFFFGCVKTTEKPVEPTAAAPTEETSVEKPGTPAPSSGLPTEIICTGVIDGQTLQTSEGETVRLLGVDTSGNDDAARKFLKTLVLAETVRLAYDVIVRDELHRILAYGYLKNGVFINAELIRRGYAVVYTRYPIRYLDDFRRYESLARETRVGRWATPVERPAERVKERPPRVKR